MLHIPILRRGQPYTSVDRARTLHIRTREHFVEISQANPGLNGLEHPRQPPLPRPDRGSRWHQRALHQHPRPVLHRHRQHRHDQALKVAGAAEGRRVDVAVHHLDNAEAAERLAAALAALGAGDAVLVSELSAVLAVHVGPGTVGVVVSPAV